MSAPRMGRPPLSVVERAGDRGDDRRRYSVRMPVALALSLELECSERGRGEPVNALILEILCERAARRAKAAK